MSAYTAVKKRSADDLHTGVGTNFFSDEKFGHISNAETQRRAKLSLAVVQAVLAKDHQDWYRYGVVLTNDTGYLAHENSNEIIRGCETEADVIPRMVSIRISDDSTKKELATMLFIQTYTVTHDPILDKRNEFIFTDVVYTFGVRRVINCVLSVDEVRRIFLKFVELEKIENADVLSKLIKGEQPSENIGISEDIASDSENPSSSDDDDE
jgi:hypothetical protein